MTNNKNHLAIDMGSSSTRIILFESNDKTLEFKKVIHRFENKKIITEKNILWDYQDIFENIKKGINLVDVKIDTIGIDGWGVDFAYLDENNNILDKVFCYRDEQAQKVFANWKEDLFKETGVSNSHINTSIQIARDNEIRPDVVKSAKYILNISDLFNFLLTGVVCNEYSIAKTTQMLDKEKMTLSQKVKQILQIENISLNPKQAGEVIGKLKDEVITNENLKETKLVLVSGHDTASALVPLNLSEGDGFVALGSWLVAGTVIDKPIINDEVQKLELSNEGDAFGKIKLLKNINGLYLLQAVSKELNMDFPSLIAKAKQATNKQSFDSNHPILLDETKTMFERIDKYCEEFKMNKPKETGEYLKTIYNSLVESVRKTMLDINKITKVKPSKIVLFGGGVQDKFLIEQLTQNLKDICKVEVGPIESTSFGNAMMQCASINGIATNEIKIKEEKK